MVSSLILAYYLHHFQVTNTPDLRPPQTYREIRTTEHHSSLDVTVVPKAGGTVPPGANRVNMLELKFKARCGGSDVSLKSLALKRKGMGNYRDIKYIYAMHDQTRLSGMHRLNRRDGRIRLRVRSFTIPACEEKTIMIYADFYASAQNAGEHRIVLQSADDIVSSATDIKIFEKSSRATSEEEEVDSDRLECGSRGLYMMGSRFSSTEAGQCGAEAATVSVGGEEVGEISVEYLKLLRRVTYGPRRTVARFILRADEKDDHKIRAITMTNEGSARNKDLHNLWLPGSKTSRYLEGDRVRIVFDPPLIIRKNHERLMTLRADIRASRRRTIKFVVDEPADIEAEVIRGRYNN